MEIIHTPEAMQAFAETLRASGKTIGLVPTMGFLHEGHLSLIDIAGAHADEVVVSIFVNPTQFAAGEDLDAYPRDMERDLDLCRDKGVAAVFTPDAGTLYPTGFETYVEPGNLTRHLCGLSRPTHFRGVTTIVSKLFNMTKPHVAVFGEKDFQQLAVIRRMTRDLNFDITIIGGPIVREADGLAKSSRNAYLKPEHRPAACSLHQGLNEGAALIQAGETDAEAVRKAITSCITAHASTEIDYISICDPETLEEMEIIHKPVLMALAVKVGFPRLIDNRLVAD
ncbi:MAG: pantoate--beta-alanine ligase [Deltaproteobacteria bacterium]|nr:MAG: pantoate--beta-alanine ligase [Deltaproteobacteria bacterium]